MVKSVFALIFLCCFIACNEKRKQISTKDLHVANLPVEKNDTFLVRYIDTIKGSQLKFNQEFAFDTIELYIKKSKTDKYLTIPRLINVKDTAIEKKLRKEIFSITNSFDVPRIDEESKKIIDGEIYMHPINIFRNKRVISYCFEASYSDTALMRPFCSYDCINYDTRLDKFFKFSFFFDIRSSEDSLYFKKLILSAVREESSMYMLSLDDKIDFSMNDDYIFFYFDAYELGAPFNIGGGIKRKYLARFIKDEYK